MKVIQLINLHRFRGGADVMAEESARLLTQNVQEAILLTRDSRELGEGWRGNVRAFINGIYSRSGIRMTAAALREHQPDVVHVHEVYPFFSPWALQECRKAGVPVVMTCHDYRLTCPVATHLCGNDICERCLNNREHWCFLKNCRGKRFESLAYALRSIVARKNRLFLDNVTLYTTPSAFVRRRLTEAHYPADRIHVLPNMVPIPETTTDAASNAYAVYVGRISPEKGIESLLDAQRLSGVPLRIAGDYGSMPDSAANASPDVSFVGVLDRNTLSDFYRQARFLIFPSVWHETFGLVIAEAMSHGLPVIAARIGAIPEVVDDGVTGLLFEPGNVAELADKMRLLSDDADLCRRLGAAGRTKVLRDYNPDAYYKRLMDIYEEAIAINQAGGSN